MNHFLLPPRSTVSFSGGRTSAYMLRMILDAFGGELPSEVKVIFNNTGKERPETLDFVHECEKRWNVPVIWLELVVTDQGYSFKQVNYETASRNGEPFEQLVIKRGYLPTPVMRLCTGELKARTGSRYCSSIGWDTWTSAIGIRADEPRRIKKTSSEDLGPDLFGVKKKKRVWKGGAGEKISYPLASAGVTEEVVLDYWSSSPFDLALRKDQGNCDLCFLKGAQKILTILREDPSLADWWIDLESKMGKTFRVDRPDYSNLKRIALNQIEEPGHLWADKGPDGSCGSVEECRCTD